MADADRPPAVTIACEDRDFLEWHGGIPHAFLWGFTIPMALDGPREALTNYVLPRHERQAHVTVAYCGLAGSEFDDIRLTDDLRILRRLARGPVDIEPSGWSTFDPSPVLEVRSQWVHDAHLALAEGVPWRTLNPFRPHITLGSYRGTWPFDEPLAHLAGLPLPGPWRCAKLKLLRYDTADIAGPLTVVGEFDLDEATYATR